MTSSDDLKRNPLVHPPKLPYGALPLNRVRLKDFKPAFEYALAEVKGEIEAIKNNTDPATFENTIVALEFAGKTLGRASSVLGLFTSSKISKAVMKIKQEVSPALSKFSGELFQDEDLFSRVEAVYKGPEVDKLSVAQKRLLQSTYDNFAANGFGLEENDRKRFIEIQQRLSVLSTQFSTNSAAASEEYKYFITDEAMLDGIPENDKKEFRENAIAAGKPDQWLIVMEPYPQVIMTHAKNRDLREELSRAAATMCHSGKYDNHAIIIEMITLKHESAKLLGYDSIASEILEKNMARDVGTVNAFLQRSLEVYKPAAEEYLQKVRDFALETEGLADLKPWDVPYYGRALKEKLFGFDAEALRPYFELNSAINAITELARDVFNLELKPTKGKYPVHHKDVKVYEVFNRESGAFVSRFYANYYARPGAKSGGAWMDQLQSRSVCNGEVTTPDVSNDCNYKKQEDGSPTFLYFEQTETMAHEFGHAGHGMLTRASELGVDEYPSQSGTNVVRDWVELPSQFLEPFMMAKARDPNDNFGRSQTGEKIPLELLDRMEAARKFEAGYAGLRQTFLGMLDMKWHTTDPATIKSVEDLEGSVAAIASVMPRVYGAMSTDFSHLFGGGYAAGYYGYKYTEVMSADSFEVSQAKGKLYDRDFLDPMVQYVYQTGDQEDPAVSYQRLHGRAPDPDALFRSEGLLPPLAPSP